jgi:hypothetical protein
MITSDDPELSKNLDKYLAFRLSQPGYFARTGWQAWLHLAVNEPKAFPVKLKHFLDTVASPLLLPVGHSSLDGMLHSYYFVHGERMFSGALYDWREAPPEQTLAQLREAKWVKLTSSMSILLTQSLLNRHVSTIAGVRSRE